MGGGRPNSAGMNGVLETLSIARASAYGEGGCGWWPYLEFGSGS